MANINIKRFVNINIVHHAVGSINSLRDTVVLLSSESSTSTYTDEIYSSLSDFESKQTSANLPLTTSYLNMYFANGGQKVRVIYGITSAELLSDTIDNLPNEQIVVAYTGDYLLIQAEATSRANSTATTINGIYGINRKILLGRLTEAAETNISDFAVKVSAITGAEMTIAAYLSKIDIYGTNSVHDYAFTRETITPEENDDDVLGDVLTYDMNVDMNLANATRNLGGNLTDGLDIVNEFMLIVLQQTLTDRILNLLTTKIKGESGLAAIQTVMVEELGRYITNGYLSQDKIWTDENLTISYNNVTYTIIEQNTPLSAGYYIRILPLNSLSAEEKAERKTPPIYVIIADSYGIRVVTVNGEVL